jgi:hypothetical protein
VDLNIKLWKGHKPFMPLDVTPVQSKTPYIMENRCIDLLN